MVSLHHPGEPATHGFTSALSVIVPLVGELGWDGGGFFALRIASLAALVVTIVCAAGIGNRLRVSQWHMLFPLTYLALDQNQIFYGMSGMETQIATAVLIGVHLLAASSNGARSLEHCLDWRSSRDPTSSCSSCRRSCSWSIRSRRGAIVADRGLRCASFFPWIAFTTLYYGSPVPNTIHAKSARHRT